MSTNTRFTALSPPEPAASWADAISAVNVASMGNGARSFTPAGAKPFDPADVLPTEAREKLLGLRAERDDARAMVSAAWDRLEEVQEPAQAASTRLQHLAEELSHARDIRSRQARLADHPRFVEATERARWTEEALKRARQSYETRSVRVQALASLVTNLEAWLRDLPPGSTVIEHHVEPAKPRKGETVFDAVERLRRRLEDLRADLVQVERAPITSAAAKARARGEIEALAQRGVPDTFALIENAAPLVWPTAKAEVVSWKDGRLDPFVPTVTAVDSRAVLCWLFKDEMARKVEAEIELRSDDANALTDEQRALRKAELEADILDVQREEESLIMTAGGDIPRRPDSAPPAILGVTVATSRDADDERAPVEALAS
jgi:hypothetical protein